MDASATDRRRVCVPKYLARSAWHHADTIAGAINPKNRRPRAERGGAGERLATLRRVYWGAEGGVHLTVGFLDAPERALRQKILAHMNAWGETANVSFVESDVSPEVRVARSDSPDMAGYWSYLGTDILSIPPDQPTMNLEGFTVRTPDSEIARVVRHETGHTLGFPHEHLRRELVERLDRAKVIAAFGASQGWSAQEVVDQILTPIEEASLIGGEADARSIMCYEIDGALTKDGAPIVGGLDIDAVDRRIAGRLYPKGRG